MAIVSQLCISFPYVLHGLCEDYLTCDIAFNAVMPLSRASTRGRYSRIKGVIDYLPDDVHYDILEVDEHKYHYGKPLIKDERSLTTMMRRLHDWYMKTCRESDGMSTLTPRVKSEHDLVGIELLNVPFEDFFQFYNQKALDKRMITCYCL